MGGFYWRNHPWKKGHLTMRPDHPDPTTEPSTWQHIRDSVAVEDGTAGRPPRPPSGITPSGYGDPRKVADFAHIEDKPPAGVTAEVARLFERLALEAAGAGFKRYSSNMLVNHIRWHFQIERRQADFKINDHVSPVLARWFLARHPELPKFFELRERDVTKLAEGAGA